MGKEKEQISGRDSTAGARKFFKRLFRGRSHKILGWKFDLSVVHKRRFFLSFSLCVNKVLPVSVSFLMNNA